jgi:hypothetical protein
MNAEHKEFISIYSEVYPEGYCQHLISEFERLAAANAGFNRQQGEGAHRHAKDDYQISLNFGAHSVRGFNDNSVVNVFFNGIQKCYNEYVQRFSVLTHGKIIGTHMKMQRVSPGGGYHLWHAEQGSGYDANRVLVYMLYLNTLADNEAGETEFLYQQMRIKPVENTVILWPAAFTHAHRGNVVHGTNSKYIVTGWFYYE